MIFIPVLKNDNEKKNKNIKAASKNQALEKFRYRPTLAGTYHYQNQKRLLLHTSSVW